MKKIVLTIAIILGLGMTTFSQENSHGPSLPNFGQSVDFDSSSQNISLTTGWNWFSPNVEITLDDLKAALTEALPDATSITIKSQTQSTSYNGNGWRGALNTIDIALMYEIYAPESCTITLSGLPINPTEHPVTIVANGNTWIGFPLNESMSVTTAFAGLNPANGDIIKSKEGRTTFNGTIWRGTFTTLEPGQGYIYKSNANEGKTFVFPSDR